MGSQHLEPVRRGVASQVVLNNAVDRIAVRDACALGGETGVCLKALGFADQRQKRFPVRVVVHQGAHKAVRRGVGLAVGGQHAAVAHGANGRLPGGATQVLAEYKLQQALKHRHLHALAAPGSHAGQKCSHDGVHHVQPGHAVGKGGRHVARFGAAALGHQPGNAGGALNQVVIGRPVGVRAALAVAIGAAVDDARVDGLHGLPRQPQARHAGRANVVGQHVGGGAQLEQRGTVVCLLEVQHHRALVAVGVDEDMAHARVLHGTGMAHDVAAGWLDLDDVGPIVAQDLRRVGAEHHAGHIDNTIAVQCPGG